VTDDIVARLRRFTANNADWPTIAEAADEIERLHAELAKYKRMYCRMACRDLYASGVKWKTKPNKMRDDGVFIEEDCEPGMNRTFGAFPIQFAHDDANQIVELLNRAADELAREAK
jgi:hypothetical protein